MAEPWREQVGSLEEEADRMVQAAAAWWGARRPEPAEDADTGAEARDAGHRRADRGDEGGAGHWGRPREAESADNQTCTGCPWCRAKSGMGPIGADALDGLADLLSAASSSLRSFADHRRADHGASTAERSRDAAGSTNRGDTAGRWGAWDEQSYGVDEAAQEVETPLADDSTASGSRADGIDPR